MIILEWLNLTAEVENLEKLREYIRIHHVPDTAHVKMRIKIPLCAMEDIIQYIDHEKGKVL